MFVSKPKNCLLAVLLGLAVAVPAVAHSPREQSEIPHMPGHMQGMGPGMMMDGYGPMMNQNMGMMHPGAMMYGMNMMPCPIPRDFSDSGLKLNEEQQEKMSRIRSQLWQLQQEQMETMWKHHNHMQELWQQGRPDRNKILGAHKELQQQQFKTLEQRLKLQEDMEQLLTDEQRQQLWQMRQRLYSPEQ